MAKREIFFSVLLVVTVVVVVVAAAVAGSGSCNTNTSDLYYCIEMNFPHKFCIKHVSRMYT